MPAIAREGDAAAGLCPLHSPPITVTGTIDAGMGSPDSNAEGKPIAFVDTTVTASCGHSATITTGSSKLKVNGKIAAIVGSLVAGDWSGAITAGASKSNAA